MQLLMCMDEVLAAQLATYVSPFNHCCTENGFTDAAMPGHFARLLLVSTVLKVMQVSEEDEDYEDNSFDSYTMRKQ